MVVVVENVSLTNVWEESFNDRETGQPVKFYRALLSKAGEPPTQLGVSEEDFETLSSEVGTVGDATLMIDAQPGRRVRVRLLAIE